MTNIDRAAEVLWLPEPHLFTSECDDQARELAQALADATPPLLMPDLPKTQFADDGTPYWRADEEVYQPSRTRGFVDGVDAYGEPFSYPVEDFKERALAMLAAVYYIEKNQE